MALRIRALDSTLAGNHVHSREEFLGSISSTPKFVPNVFAACQQRFRYAPSKGHLTRYITLSFKGTYSVMSFYELMRMLYACLRYVLR